MCSCRNSVNENFNQPQRVLSGDTLINEYSRAFRMIQRKEHIQIDIIRPETNTVEFRYAIGDGDFGDLEVIPLNLDRIVALSATHLGMLSELDEIERLVGLSSPHYVCDGRIIEGLNKGKIKSLGDLGEADLEGYLSVRPKIVVYSGFDHSVPAIHKLKSAGLTLMVNYDWRETHPLGRLEWLKVWGVLLGMEEEAESLYVERRNKYLECKDSNPSSNKPSVLVGTVYGDVFNAPAGDSYMAQIIKDAGGDYVYKNTPGTGSLSLQIEELLMQNQTTNIWLNVAAKSIHEVLRMDNRFELLDAIKNKATFSYYHNVNCFWEQSIVSPHILLEDLKNMFYSTLNDNKLHYYLKLE